MSVKSKLAILLTVAVIACFSVGISAANATAQIPQQTSSQSKADYYTLISYGKKLAIFKNSEKEPVYVIDVLVDELPERDRTILKNGIRSSSLSEAMLMAEDYE